MANGSYLERKPRTTVWKQYDRGPKTWELVPEEIRNSKSLSQFKANIKNWKPQGCTCRLCKTFIYNLGYL